MNIKIWKTIHKRLHQSAAKVLAALKEGKRDHAIKIYQEETMPVLSEVQDKITEMRLGVKKLIDKSVADMRSG